MDSREAKKMLKCSVDQVQLLEYLVGDGLRGVVCRRVLRAAMRFFELVEFADADRTDDRLLDMGEDVVSVSCALFVLRGMSLLLCAEDGALLKNEDARDAFGKELHEKCMLELLRALEAFFKEKLGEKCPTLFSFVESF